MRKLAVRQGHLMRRAFHNADLDLVSTSLLPGGNAAGDWGPCVVGPIKQERGHADVCKDWRGIEVHFIAPRTAGSRIWRLFRQEGPIPPGLRPGRLELSCELVS